MHDAIESDLLAARLPPFAHDEAAWIDHYVLARARLDPSLVPAHADAAARAAWASHGWAHPAAVAYLEHGSGRAATAEQRQRPAPARQRMLPVWPSE